MSIDKPVLNKPWLQGKWNELKGKAREMWGELTDDDLDKVEGQKDQLVGLLQQHYGRQRAEAEAEVEAWEQQLGLREQGSLTGKIANKVAELDKKQVAAGVGAAAAVALGVAAIRKLRPARGEGDAMSVYHLEPQEEGWKLTLEGALGAEAHFDTKEEGLAAARELAGEQAPSQLVVHRSDGSEQSRHRYDD